MSVAWNSLVQHEQNSSSTPTPRQEITVAVETPFAARIGVGSTDSPRLFVTDQNSANLNTAQKHKLVDAMALSWDGMVASATDSDNASDNDSDDDINGFIDGGSDGVSVGSREWAHQA